MTLVDEFLVDIEKMELDKEFLSIKILSGKIQHDIFKMNDFLSNSDISLVAKLKDSLLFEEIMKKN
jgi:hypothetical protein